MLQAGTTVSPSGTGAVKAGPGGRHEANVLAVKARDSHRYGYRLWADRASGLLLRADVIGERGETLETAAFSEVSIGVRAQPDSIVQAMKKLDGYRIVKPALTSTRLEAEGWTMRPVTPGFKLVSCIRRQMEMLGVAAFQRCRDTRRSTPTAYLSTVFIERFRADRHTEPVVSVSCDRDCGSARHWWVTVVGDTPPATLRFCCSVSRKSR